MMEHATMLVVDNGKNWVECRQPCDWQQANGPIDRLLLLGEGHEATMVGDTEAALRVLDELGDSL